MPDADRLSEIHARAAAATPGPWCTDAWEIYQGTEYTPDVSQWIGETCRGTTTCAQDRADATFVAAAREDVPWLLDQLRQKDADNAELAAKLTVAERQLKRLDDDLVRLQGGVTA